jgi:hypothetical protein
MNKQLNVASFDDHMVAEDQEQNNESESEEQLPKKKSVRSKRPGKKSAPARTKIMEEHENMVQKYMQER